METHQPGLLHGRRWRRLGLLREKARSSREAGEVAARAVHEEDCQRAQHLWKEARICQDESQRGAVGGMTVLVGVELQRSRSSVEAV